MPELPDLEIFAVNLEKRFKNKTLEKLEVIVPKRLNVSETELKEALEGHQLQAVLREGKTMQLHFGGGNVLGLHLMLHGEIRLVEKDDQVKFRIIEFHFKGDNSFALTDFQKMATPTLNPEPSEVPDALSKDFTITYLKELLSKKKIQIKTLLMDQHLIRGIGNTYADEILWHTRISPFSIAKAIPEKKVKDLYQGIEEVLRKEIMQLTRAIPDSFNAEVKDFLKIHNPDLKHSPTGHEIKIDKIGGRKTYYTDEQVQYNL
ncbi:Fpg/Nei family DNA glycosylase [Pedobacter metabolipauper]|uniref:Formamidopyrimidine-DNA glycosylase n=1 Tax=Pedobacter metabolipauper TaxID=425513 RepID=A0A4R6SX52_9SPHI|nr:DNA-formamidopyrimidine glycosylase family protein [Pedobacter metabolipauper]TDQ09214.1 formamidopyrimidine-DNA glycosylase [Pedobacter metabolipauper]